MKELEKIVDSNGEPLEIVDAEAREDISEIKQSLSQLTEDTTLVDTKPYIYKQSPVGYTSVSLKIVGGTVAWNQQLSLSNLPSDSALYSNTTYTVNGVTFTKNNDGSITIQTESGGATSETSVKIGDDARLGFIKKHIHYIPRCKGGSASTYYFNYAGSRYVYDNDKIFAKQPSGFNLWLTVKQGTVITTPVKVYPQVVDLEQMFGTTIADAVYTMEEAEAGSGITWLKSYGFITNEYYAYDSGSLQSVNVASRKVYDSNDTLVATYPLDSSLTLRGIPKLSDGELYYDGDIYSSDGTVIRNYEERAYQSGDESLTDAITDGTNTVVKKLTPTTESSQPYTNPQLVGSTEEFVDAGTTAIPPTRDVDIPVGQGGTYHTNIIYKIMAESLV